MSKTKTLLELAAGLAAGDLTEDALREIYDDDTVASIASAAGGLLAGGIVTGAVKSVLDTEVATDITDVADEILDDIGDTLSDLNPFSGW